MTYWPLRTVSSDFQFSVAQVASMLGRVGSLPAKAIASELLQAISSEVPVAQCTIFAYQDGEAPQIISFADRARTPELPTISHSYAWRFYSLDGNRNVMSVEGARPQGAKNIFVHHQSREEIENPDYRRICYELPKISERLALLSMFDGRRWLSLNFYRGREYGVFSQREIDFIEGMAPLLMQLLRLHYNSHVYENELPQFVTERVARLHPELTRRERELLRNVLSGRESETIAKTMGLQLSSVQTYVKRLYRKLGVSSQRELIGLALQPVVTE